MSEYRKASPVVTRRYPLAEPCEYRFRCPGCLAGYNTSIPRHGAPFFHRCKTEGCGWTTTIQSDPAGISIGHTAALPKKHDLHIVRGED